MADFLPAAARVTTLTSLTPTARRLHAHMGYNEEHGNRVGTMVLSSTQRAIKWRPSSKTASI